MYYFHRVTIGISLESGRTAVRLLNGGDTRLASLPKAHH